MEKTSYLELTPNEFLKRLNAAPIAYLPLGTLEWHGPHMPLGSDCFHSSAILTKLAEQVGGIVLPPIFLAPDTETMTLPDGTELYGMDCVDLPDPTHKYPPQQLTGTAYWVPNETFAIILDAILKQLARAGFKIVVGHGHAPSRNFFKDNIHHYKKQFDLDCFTLHQKENEPDYIPIPSEHAGKTETSLNLAINPHLVHLENLDENTWPIGVGGTDHPKTTATPEIGRKILDFHLKRMKKILHQALRSIDH